MGAGRSGRGPDGLVEPVVDHLGPGGLAQASAGAIGTGSRSAVANASPRSQAPAYTAIRVRVNWPPSSASANQTVVPMAPSRSR
jgi:hypothetical protein